ncbi:MAG: competence protein ComEC, partial [Prochlorococcaceae cyanobacterium]
MPAVVVALALVALSLGVVPLADPFRWLALVPLIAWAGWLGQRRAWGLCQRALLLSLLPLLLVWGLIHQNHPGPADPSRLLGAAPIAVLEGRLAADPQPLSAGEGCRAVLEQAGGATE